MIESLRCIAIIWCIVIDLSRSYYNNNYVAALKLILSITLELALEMKLKKEGQLTVYFKQLVLMCIQLINVLGLYNLLYYMNIKVRNFTSL